MGSPRDRDPVDAWLNAEVEPLAPRPGTFERIRHRARRRKAAKAAMSGAGIVIVVAAAATVPRISSTLFQSHNATPPRVSAEASGKPRPTPASRANESLNAKSPAALQQPGTSSLGTPGNPVPRNFQPTSVTFVSLSTGAVIGQAGRPGHCGPPVPSDCTSLAGTSDYGATWYGVSAPVTGAPDGSRGVGQLRFLNAHDGWAFGPALWVTHDGGAHWTQEQTYGMRVTDLETAGGRAFAIFATCAGTGASYAATCSSFSLYSSPAESDQWKRVPASVSPGGPILPAAAPPRSASLVLSGGTGYLLAPSGELLSGPLTGAAWTAASAPVVSRHVSCLPGAPGPSGQPTGTMLAANGNELVLVCTSATSAAGDTQAKLIVESTDRGAHWSAMGTAPAAGIATSVAVQAQDHLVVLATDSGLYLSANGGRSWQLTQPSPGGAAAAAPGFSYVGMTSPAQGVALPADAGLHEVFITTDGGSSWRPRLVSRP
ncbi:MAG TPA: hypothetical protein VGR98_21850 [Streptosporangiaceae bacterium]|nr:hypothetical protein [Streptosporangiaceae bacterium]